MPTLPEPNSTIGRFALHRLLGAGRHTSVWLGYDPQSNRDVALKLWAASADLDEGWMSRWQKDARALSQLHHPNLVTLYGAESADSTPYVVMEYVPGDTLAQRIQRRGPQPAREAVTCMADVLEGLACAHEQGVVHQDIKPSNILIDRQGRARLTDFVLGARVAHPPSADVWACGRVLAEWLTDQPSVDDALRSIILRSTASQPDARFQTANEFASALRQWLQPALESPSSDAASTKGTLEFLMRRMRHKSDFPAMSSSIGRILSMAGSESESIHSITSHILQDVALTNKLLRTINSAVHSRSDSVSTVSRAVQLVGFHGIRNLALSLILLEHMQDKDHAALLKEEFVHALLAGTLGYELSPTSREAEDAFLGGVFQNLGRLLTLFYFPEEAELVRKLQSSGAQEMTEAHASAQVLGLSYEDLGVGVAKAWGLPDSIQRRMVRPLGSPPGRAAIDTAERLRWISEAANDMARILIDHTSDEARPRLAAAARRFATVLDVKDAQLLASVEKARQKLQDMARAMDLRVRPGGGAHRMLYPEHAPPVAPGHPATGRDDDCPITELAPQPAAGQDPRSQSTHRGGQSTTDTLAAGIQDITNAMVSDFKLADVLRMVIETMFRAIGFDRVVFCMRDAKTDTVCGRLGLGEGSAELVKLFKIPLQVPKPDLMAAVCLKGIDSLISDSTDAKIQSRLPAWYASSAGARSFLLLPLHVKGTPLGLIYADTLGNVPLALDERELTLLRTLRSQAIMAFKHARHGP